MSDNITGKTILLICDHHYGCDKLMTDGLLNLGAKEVVQKTLDARIGLRDPLTIGSLYHFLRNPKEGNMSTQELVREIDQYRFDVCLCVENTYFSKWFLDYLRDKNPDVKLVLFLWDVVKKHHPRYGDYYPKFDKIYIFDRDEAEKYGFEYFPDFYIGDETEREECIYDISFVGSMRRGTTMKRAEILYRVKSLCDQHNLKYYLRLRPSNDYGEDKPGFVKKTYWQLRDKKYWETVDYYRPYGYIYDDTISLEQVDNIYSKTKVLLDLAYPGRQGMTINAITALAKGKKLITTNERIKEEPFYDPNTIYVLDEDNPELDISFFEKPTKKVDMTYLRVDNWLKHILNGDMIGGGRLNNISVVLFFVPSESDEEEMAA